MAEAPPLRIALDRQVRARHGPELTWTWRQVLTAVGRPWTEVDVDDEADIAHVAEGRHDTAHLVIRADIARWDSPAADEVRGLRHSAGWSWMDYGDEMRPPQVGERQTVIPHDVLFDVFRLMTALAEEGWPRDAHGNPEPSRAFLDTGLARAALGSDIANAIDRSLLGHGLLPGLARWPGGHGAAACLTHDVDYPEVIRWLEPFRVLRRRGLHGARAAADVALGRRSMWQFPAWLRDERRLGVRSAFYFVARKGSLVEYATHTPDPFYDITAPRFRELFRTLNSEGAEIGLHASYRAFESAERFAAEKATLEECALRPIAGNRHHYLHLGAERPEDTLLMHEKLGFGYDTTLGYERHLGWRNGVSWPFHPFHRGLGTEIRTLQIPFAWMDSHVFLYTDQNPGDPDRLLEDLAAHALAQGGCFVVNIHDYVYDDALFPGWSSTYGHLVERLATSGDFWIDTPEAVAAHWTARATTLLRASHGLATDQVTAA